MIKISENITVTLQENGNFLGLPPLPVGEGEGGEVLNILIL
jgi:hypothetical protein